MIKNIIFDFDGVILDSVPVKTEAFRLLFHDFPSKLVDKFIEYHLVNGGKSRYIKIRYFFETLLKHKIDENVVKKYAQKYSELTKNELSKSQYLIEDTIQFIKANYSKYNMHIASGADDNDLRYICNSLKLNHFFKTIEGSPRTKVDIISNILINHGYACNETIMIGDSINDYDAAKANGITFYGYNNKKLSALEDSFYLEKLNDFEKNL